MTKSIANQLSPSQVLGRTATLLRLLEEEGLPYDAWQVPIDNPAKRRLLVQYWQAGMPAFEAAASSAVDPVYDIRMVSEILSFAYTEEDIHDFGPPPDALPGFLTFFDPGWNLLCLRKFCANKGKIFCPQDWYDDQAFAKKTEEPRYRQIRLEAVNGSFDKNFDEQQRLLPENEEVPSARVVVMGMVIHFLLSGQRLFAEYNVRCASMGSDGRRVGVGGFASDGFVVGSCWGDRRYGYLGLASSVPPRKS